MKWIPLFGMFLFILFTVPVEVGAEGRLQKQIDAIPSGGTLVLKDGVYQESIVLSKPITIEGSNNTVISVCTKEPAITIKGGNVSVNNLQVKSCSQEKGAAAIEISGEKHRLENIIISTSQYGIKLNGANQSTIKNVVITGKEQENGIDLWESSHNLISNSTIQHVQDGVYLEKSHCNRIVDNVVKHSRYGFHLMFSDQTELMNNQSSSNSTGAMVMGTKDTIVENNALLANNENFHAQGLLLYDTVHAKITDNNISHNRVGMYIENAAQNTIENNILSQNFIGMQFQTSENNVVQNNSFFGNVNDSQAINSPKNKIQGNYWDLSIKLDIDGNGTSVIPYTSDPYFLSMTNYTPEFQLFFHSPGMLVMQKLLKSEEDTLLRDETPRMTTGKSIASDHASNVKLWILSFTMIFVSLIFFLNSFSRRPPHL